MSELMNKKNLYLHMGFHKTATTSFQATCKANIDNLAAQGFLYPLFSSKSTNRRDIANHSIPIVSSFTEDPEKYGGNIKWGVNDVAANNKDYLNQLDALLLTEKNVILSGEGISHLTEISLRNLLAFIEQYHFNIIPMACIRSPYEFNCSQKQEQIKRGGYIDLSSFASQIGKVKKLHSVFENKITYIPFKISCKHRLGPAGYLLEYSGVDCSKIEMVNANEGMSNLNVRMQNALNKKNPKIINGKVNRKWKSISFLGDVKSKFLLAPEEYESVKKTCQRENKLFSKYLGDEFCDMKIEFSSPQYNVDEFAHVMVNNTPDNSYADTLIEAALKLESDNLDLAYKLMCLAHMIRPEGAFIKKKIDEYEANLQK